MSLDLEEHHRLVTLKKDVFCKILVPHTDMADVINYMTFCCEVDANKLFQVL